MPAELGDDRRFQVTVVAHQMLHHFQQIGERLDGIHEILGGHIAVHGLDFQALFAVQDGRRGAESLHLTPEAAL